MPSGAALDVVIVSYECRELLARCLESLRTASSWPRRVHVVDNASSDGTPELVREGFPEADLVASARNLGFAAAANIGIARGQASYVLVLNPDTRLPAGALDPLLALMDERPEVGICGCRLETEEGRFDHAARRSFPTVLGALGHATGLGRRDRAPAPLAQYRATAVARGPVDAVNGAFMLVRRRALDEVGLFDEGYWMYFEDLDLCYRFARAGWTTWYEADVTVVHTKGGSAGRHRAPRLNVAFHRGFLRFYRLHCASERNPAVNGAVYAGVGVKLLASLARSALGRRLAAAGP